MSLPRIFSTLLCSFLLIFETSFAQQSPTLAPQRDPQALAVLQNSIAAMGGAAAIAKITDAVVTGSVTPSSASPTTAKTFKWETAASEYRYDFQSSSASQTFVSGHGHPASIRNGTVTPASSQLDFINAPFHLPAIVLAAAVANQACSITGGGKSTVNGVAAIKVRISLDTGMLSTLVSPQDWYFDAATAIPLRVEHRLPDTRRPENYVLAAEDFSDFRVVAGLLVPFKITSYEEEKLVAIETISTVSFNNGLSSTEFDAPAGGAL